MPAESTSSSGLHANRDADGGRLEGGGGTDHDGEGDHDSVGAGLGHSVSPSTVVSLCHGATSNGSVECGAVSSRNRNFMC